jgi:hypothetical protein
VRCFAKVPQMSGIEKQQKIAVLNQQKKVDFKVNICLCSRLAVQNTERRATINNGKNDSLVSIR